MVLKDGFKITDTDLFEYNAFHHAAVNGVIKSVKFLIKCGADPFLRNSFGHTSLHEAANNGHLESVAAILQYVPGIDGADHTTKMLATSLRETDKGKHENEKRELISLKDDIGYTALHLAVRNGHMETVDYMVEQGAEFLTTNKSMDTLLHTAAAHGHSEVIDYLIQHGCPIDARNLNGWTPMHMACLKRHSHIVQILLNHGANKFAIDKEGMNTLHCVCHGDSTYLLDLLLKNGLNIADRDWQGNSGLHYAAGNGNLELVVAILQQLSNIDGAAPTTIMSGSSQRETTDIKHVNLKRELLSLRNNDGFTSLHSAVGKGHIKIVDYLVQQGADVLTTDVYRNTLLHSAIYYGHLDLVDHLITLGCDLNARNVAGLTPLLVAAIDGNLQAVMMLLKHGAWLPML